MIRVRRLPKRRFRRPLYEVEFRPSSEQVQGWHKVTAHPIFDLESVVGTGDAWAKLTGAGPFHSCPSSGPVAPSPEVPESTHYLGRR
jgi:hypothetical protein